MALKTVEEERGGITCPRCGQKMLVIDGSFIRWLTCPHCKHKKLEEKKEGKKIRVTPMMEGNRPM